MNQEPSSIHLDELGELGGLNSDRVESSQDSSQLSIFTTSLSRVDHQRVDPTAATNVTAGGGFAHLSLVEL